MGLTQPADLPWFMHALELAAGRPEGFEREELALVEAAWQIVDAAVSSFGWVVRLKDGTRHYVEYICANTEEGEPEILEITALAADQLVPKLDIDAGVSWYHPYHINRSLGLEGPPPS
jgi:hypothetical protein